MKTTIKEFTTKQELKKSLSNNAENAKYNGDYEAYVQLTKKVEELEKEYFSKLDRVNVSYLIGYRSYYTSVIKIGQSYFIHGRKMTKSRGYYCIKEIEMITKKMKDEMMADSYYY